MSWLCKLVFTESYAVICAPLRFAVFIPDSGLAFLLAKYGFAAPGGNDTARYCLVEVGMISSGFISKSSAYYESSSTFSSIVACF